HCLPGRNRIKPEQHPWSSYSQYCSRTRAGDWLVRDEVLAQLGEGARPHVRYASYVAEGTDAELAHFYGKKNLLSVLGDEKFRRQALDRVAPATLRGVSKGAQAKKRPSTRAVVRKVAEHFKVPERSIYQAARGPGSKNLPRWVAMYLCQ